MCYVGLDAGTSGIKALAFDENGMVLASSYREYHLITPREGWSELASEEIWRGAKYVLSDISHKLNGQIRVIAASSTAQAVAPFDAAGKPLYHFITTVDTRTSAQDAWWREHTDEKKFFARTGLPFSPIYTVNKLMWLKAEEPAVCDRTWKYLCVEDFLTWRLSGETLIDYSLASRGMMFHIKEHDWDEEILNIAGVDRSQLSAPVRSGSYVGKIRKALACELGICEDTAIVVGSHDQICGTIGCGAVSVGKTTDAAGTVEVLMAMTDSVPDGEKLAKYHYPCIPHAVDGRYSIMSINQNSGILLKWYRNLFCGLEQERAAALGKDSFSYMIENSGERVSDVFVLPHLNGCETPVSDPASAAAIVHMRSHHTKKDITRAVLDSIAYDLRQNIEAMESIGIRIEELQAIGGGAKTGRLLQMKADCTRKRLRTTVVTEAASLGAAIIGAVGIGDYENIESAAEHMVRTADVYDPDEKSADEYDEGYGRFRELYGMLKDFNHKVSSV